MKALLSVLLLTGCIMEPGLYIEKTGDGAGRVVSDPAGINCGNDCGMVVDGPLTLTASAVLGSRFAGWQGSTCSGTEPCVLALTDDARIEAAFEIEHYILTVTPAEHGHVTGAGIDCGTQCSADFTYGQSTQLTAIPDAGYELTGWSDGSTDGARRIVTITEPVTLGAIFTPLTSLVITKNGGGDGVVVSSAGGINCGSQCTAGFAVGTVVTLTATPGLYSHFVGWGGCMASIAQPNSCTVTVLGNTAISATFNLN